MDVLRRENIQAKISTVFCKQQSPTTCFYGAAENGEIERIPGTRIFNANFRTFEGSPFIQFNYVIPNLSDNTLPGTFYPAVLLTIWPSDRVIPPTRFACIGGKMRIQTHFLSEDV
jgi:hypothetical protein